MAQPSRRQVLTALVGAPLVVAGCGGNGKAGFEAVGAPTTTLPEPAPEQVTQLVKVVADRFVSRARKGADIRRVLTLPTAKPPKGGWPVVVVLHGHHGSSQDFAGPEGLQQAMARHLAAERPGFATIQVDGGDLFWHRRASGDDPQAMVLDEVLPALASIGLRCQPKHKIGLMGWSMGGYGALLIAERLGKKRVGAVAVDAPAVWSSYERASAAIPTAFDDAADWADNDVLAPLARLAGVPVRIDTGAEDNLLPATQLLRERLPLVAGGTTPPGGHEPRLWLEAMPAKMKLLASHIG